MLHLSNEIWKTISNYLLPLEILKIELCLKYYYKKISFEFGSNMWSYICESRQVPGLPVPLGSHRTHCANLISKTKVWTLLIFNSRNCSHCDRLNTMLPEIRSIFSKTYPHLKIKEFWYTDNGGEQIEEGQEDTSPFIPSDFKPLWFPWIMLIPNNWSNKTDFIDRSFLCNIMIINGIYHYRHLYPLSAEGLIEFVRVSLCS